MADKLDPDERKEFGVSTSDEEQAAMRKVLTEPVPSKVTQRQQVPKGTGREITPLVLADLEERSAFGTEKYGEPLTAFNGREAMWDLYQELLDAVVYIRQVLEEQDKSALEIIRAKAERILAGQIGGWITPEKAAEWLLGIIKESDRTITKIDQETKCTCAK